MTTLEISPIYNHTLRSNKFTFKTWSHLLVSTFFPSTSLLPPNNPRTAPSTKIKKKNPHLLWQRDWNPHGQGLLFQLLLTCSVVSLPLPPHGLQPTRLLCPWDSLDKNTGVGCHALLQGILLTQGTNPHILCLLHWQADFFTTESPGKPHDINQIVLKTEWYY